MSKLVTKNAFLGYFWVRIFKKSCHIVIFSYLSYCHFQKTIVMFEIRTLEFVKNEFLTQTVKFGLKAYRSGSHFF